MKVTDIADAMLLFLLFKELYKAKVIVFLTSNRHPDGEHFLKVELYQNGIQRESFIPCIELIKSNSRIVSLNHGIDYRALGIQSECSFYSQYLTLYSVQLTKKHKNNFNLEWLIMQPIQNVILFIMYCN